MRDQILSGYIAPGEFLLSENQLAKHYDMSRVSVRAALDILMNEGLVEKHERQGTMVLPQNNITRNEQNTLNIMCTYPCFYAEIVLPFAIEEFNKRFPQVKVNVVHIPHSNFDSSLDNPGFDRIHPDLHILTDDQINDINDHSQFINLNDIFPKNSDFFSDMYSYLKNYFFKNNNYNIMPLTFSTIFLAYNQKMLKDHDLPIPKSFNMDKLRRFFKKLSLDTNSDGIADQFALTILPYATRWISVANLFNVDFNNLAGSRKELIETFDFIHNLLYHDHSAVLNNELYDRVNPFYYDRAIFSISNAIELAGWKYYSDSLETYATPVLNKDKRKQMLILDGIVLSKRSRNIEMAIAFIKTLLSNTVQHGMAYTFGFPSVFKSVNEKVWKKDYLKAISLTDEIEEVFFVKDIFGDSNVFMECDLAMRLFWLGLETSENTADQVIEILGRVHHQ